MSAYLFPTYVFCHLLTLCGALYLARVHKAPGAWLVAMIAAALMYDNLIVSLGASIGIGPTLEMLSWPRFIMHALLTPFMMIAVTQMAVAGGIRWADTQQWRVIVWLLVVAMIAVGTYKGLIGLEIFPACFDGIIRYTANLSPIFFCDESAVATQSSGPPIPSIVGNLITLVVGFYLWRHQGWVWLGVGALAMFIAASIPIRTLGMAYSNGGEVLLMFSYVATVARFGVFSKSAKSI
ncbi:MAG: hypothetical protein ACR2QG_09865 [Gammaproteobacteria bacterium]